MKSVGILWLTLCAATALAQTNITAISNLGQSTFNSLPVGYEILGSTKLNSAIAVSFTTGNSICYFTNASVLMANNSGGGTFVLLLYSSVGGVPGSNLATLSGNSNPVSAGLYSYTNITPLELSANTTYWLVATNTGVAGLYDWCVTQSTNIDAGSIWALGLQDYNDLEYTNNVVSYNSGWQSYPLQAYTQFSVTVNNPQATALSISQAIVVTCPATGFPFVLQQNSNLATTNWVNVTNAILSGNIGNQSIFVLPNGGGQMFYRLNPLQ